MPKKRLTTNGNVFRRTDGRWQSVIWYFDEQGIKRRKVFSSKTKTEAQQKITTYITQFNAEVRNSDESQKTLRDSLTAPSVPADRGQNCWGHYSSRSEIRAEPLDGAGLRLHHDEKGAYPPQRVFSLLNRGRFHSEEPHAIGTDDEES